MWKLLAKDKPRTPDSITAEPWSEAGMFVSITAATRHILEIEEDESYGLHLEFHLCTITDDDDANDADALSYLEYTGKRAIYGIKRVMQ